ncbi:hypothetical protein PGB90_007227 [Kerria lacca]
MQNPSQCTVRNVEKTGMFCATRPGLLIKNDLAFSTFSGVHGHFFGPAGEVFKAETVFRKLVTHLRIVFREGNDFLGGILHFFRNARKVATVESLFLKYVSIANEQCSADHSVIVNEL